MLLLTVNIFIFLGLFLRGFVTIEETSVVQKIFVMAVRQCDKLRWRFANVINCHLSCNSSYATLELHKSSFTVVTMSIATPEGGFCLLQSMLVYYCVALACYGTC